MTDPVPPRPDAPGAGAPQPSPAPQGGGLPYASAAAPSAPAVDVDTRAQLQGLAAEIHKGVVGQDAAITSLVVALLCRGHVLL